MMTPPSVEGAATQERLVVLVPCFNEEGNIRGTVDSILEVAPRIPMGLQIVLIDDGSSDGTRARMDELRLEHGLLTMYHDQNRGVGRCLIDAYETIEPGTWVTIMPGDNEVDFRSILNFVEVRANYDVILGYLQNPVIRPMGRRFASWAYMRTVSTLYGFDCRYLNGMKLFRVEAFRGIEVRSAGHAFNAELLAKAVLTNPHLRLGEAPFVAKGRPHGRSKAIRPHAIARAVYEVILGWRSVSRFRTRVIRGAAPICIG